MTVSDPMLSTPIAQRTLASVLRKQAAERPQKTALIDDSRRRLTYAELLETGLRASAGFHNLGVGRQELVLVMLDNHIDNVVTWVGLGLGARVIVPVNGAYKGEILRYVADNSGARVAVLEGAYCDRLAAVVDGVPELTTVVVRGEPNASFPPHIAVVRMDDLIADVADSPEWPLVSDVAAVLYTSGTEGASKGVLCAHGHAFQISASYTFETRPDDVVLVTLPLFHASGLFSGVYNALRGGATAVIRGAFSASGFWDDVRSNGITQTLLMGAMADFLWRRDPGPEDRDHPLRNVCVVPAAPYINDFAARFGLNLTSAYGSAEVGTATLTAPGEAGPFLCGRPREFLDLRIVGDDDAELAPGEVGEIVVRSHEPWALMLGYHRMPEATVRAWRNLWFHTGDAGYRDAEGRLVFVDRKKDALRRRGENVSSMEVEKFILAREEVAEAAIVSVPSDYTEDEIKAVVVLAPGTTFDPEKLFRHLVDSLPYFMVPRYYAAVEALPKTPTHKVKKAELRSWGVTADTWDCQAHGFVVTRRGLEQQSAGGPRG
jgi:crotonobetaine/carnitine-CoA ligase